MPTLEGGKRTVVRKVPRNPTTEHEGRVSQPGVPSGPRNSAGGAKTVATIHPDGHVTATGPEAKAAAAEARKSLVRVRAKLAKTKVTKAGVEVNPAKGTPAIDKVPGAVESVVRDLERQDPTSSIPRKAVSEEAKNLVKVAKQSLTPGREARGIVKAPSTSEARAAGALTAPAGIEESAVGEIAGKTAEVQAAAKSASLAARGAKVGEDVVGGSKVARALGAKPVEVADTPANRAAVEAVKDTGSGVKKVVRTVTKGSRERSAARDLTGTVTRKEALHSAGAPSIFAKVAGAQVLPVVKGHEQAIIQNPGKVAATTAKALPGFITVPIGIAANVGITGGRAASSAAHELGIPGAKGYSGKEILAPVKYEGQSQLEFAKQVAKVLTSDDSAEVQKAVEDELGLLLPVTALLGAKAAADHLGKGDASAAESIADKVRATVEKVRAARGEGHGDDAKAKVFENSHQRKVESVHAAHSKRSIKAEAHDRSHEIVEHARKMDDKEVLRHGAARSKILKRPRDVVVRPADSVPFLLRNAIDLDHPKEALDEVKRIGQKIRRERKAHDLPERVDETGDLSTQDIIESLEKNPDWLKKPELKDALEAARHQERFAVEHGLSPDHSEAARVSSVAVNNDIPQAHERFPSNVRHLVRATEKAGQDAVETLRKEEKADFAKARRAKANGDLKGWQEWGDSARAKRAAAKQVKAGDPELVDATVQAVNQHIAKSKGLHNEGPEYVNTGSAAESPSIAGSTGAAPGELSKAGLSKHKSGFNERVGHSREGLGNYLESSIGAPISKRHIFANTRRFLDENKKTEAPVDSREARDIFDNEKGGINRKNFVLMDTQLTNRAYRYINQDDPRFKNIDDLEPTDEDFFEQLGKRSGIIADANALQEGRKYNIVPRAAAEEFLAQMSKARTNRLASGLNKWSNFLILNTSLAWALTQFGAEFAQAAIAEPRLLNPAKLKAYVHAYHEMDPIKRREFEAWADATTRSIGSQKDIDLALHTGKDATGAAKAFGVMNRTKLGRTLRAVPTSLRAVDEWKGGRIRVLTALAKQDRDLNGHLNRFLKGAGNLYRTESDIAEQLKGKSHKEVAEFWASHPKGAERYGKYLDEVMGNWSALTQNERVASQMLIFYPFLRMSLKWTFYSFPKEHPVRAAMSDWLGTQNAQQLEEILGGKPSFFGEFANTPLYTGSGKTPTEAAGLITPLSRLSVAGNALTEALGGSLSEPNQGPPGAKVAEAVSQPAVGAALSGLFGLNKFTGKQEAHSGKQVLEQAESLAAPARAAKKIFKSTQEQSALDELFEKLRGSLPDQLLRSNLFPQLPESVSLQKDLTSLSGALQTMETTGSDAHDKLKNKYREEGRSGEETNQAEEKLWNEYDKGKATLERLYRKYGIGPKAAKENKAYESFETERKYGGEAKGKSTSTLGRIEESVGLSGDNDTLSHIEKEAGLSGGEGTLEKIEKEVGLK